MKKTLFILVTLLIVSQSAFSNEFRFFDSIETSFQNTLNFKDALNYDFAHTISPTVKVSTIVVLIVSGSLSVIFGGAMLGGGIAGMVDGPRESVYQDSYLAMVIVGSIFTIGGLALMISGFVIIGLIFASKKSKKISVINEYDFRTNSGKLGLAIKI